MDKTILIYAVLYTFFGILLIITSSSLYQLTCLKKQTVLGTTIHTKEVFNATYIRINKIYCIDCISINQIENRFLIKSTDSNRTVEFLKNYNSIIVSSLIFDVIPESVRITASKHIEFKCLKSISSGVYFTQLTSYDNRLNNIIGTNTFLIHLNR